MKGVFDKEIEAIEQLVDRGKYDDALEQIDKISSIDSLSAEEKLKSKILKYRIYSVRSKYVEAIKLGEEAFEESKKLNNKFLMF